VTEPPRRPRPRARPDRPPSFLHRVEFVAWRVTMAVLGLIPVRTAAALGAAIGRLGYSVFRIRRRLVDHQLAAAFPELGDADRKRIAIGSYAHLGRVAVEATLFSRMPRDRFLEMFHEPSGWHHLESAMADGRGAMAIAGHFGNWEVGVPYIAARGLGVSPVGRRMVNPLFNDAVEATRARLGVHMISDREMVSQLPRRLAAGHLVPILADQGTKGIAAVFVPFFGRLALTPKGPALMALRLRVPCLFLAVPREPDGRYRLCIEPLPAVRTGDREHDVETLVAAHTRMLEQWIRRYPEQYLWQHRRWRRRPDGSLEDV
jgi:KDO2-lipid IV(A) lauroyltransferase